MIVLVGNSRQKSIHELYDNAVKHYGENRHAFSSPYDVYAEKMFIKMHESKVSSPEFNLRYSIFKNTLRQWAEDKKEFSEQRFRKALEDNLRKRKFTTYTFYFGVHVKLASGATFPIEKTITINGVHYKRVTYDVIKKKSKDYLTHLKDEYKKQRYTNDAWISGVLYREYFYFKATVSSLDELVAANVVIENFELINAAMSLAQERHVKVEYWGSGKIKSRKPMQSPYMLYWAEAQNEHAAILQDLASGISKPDAKIQFTAREDRVKMYKKYLRIFGKGRPSPIEKRIKDFALEFNKALEVDEAHLRMLSLWRCIEIATRLSNGMTRKQQDIKEILAHYYTDDFWKEQGDLILALRNGYVHEGRGINYQSRDKYLNWVQDYANVSLSLLMWMRDSKIGVHSSAEIDTFFNLYTKPEETFNVARIMQNARKKL